jgi:hypothetical protein
LAFANSATWRKKTGAAGGETPLKNGGGGPIQTLNVVTGPPEVGEVNTSSRAYEGPVD